MTTNAPVTSANVPAATPRDPTFARGLGLFDSVMVVVGVMIGSGIFIVSADMSRQIGSAGWLLVAWIFTGVLTIAGALSYGELAAMMPRAGGMYIYLREAFSPLWGFLYGWTLCTVIQTGTIAAVAIAFARFSGVLFPSVSESHYLIPPIHVSSGYAFSLSSAQLVAIGIIALLTWTNSRGLQYDRPARLDRARPHPRLERRWRPRKFQQRLDRSRRFSTRRWTQRHHRIRSVRSHLRSANRLAFLR